MNTIIEFVNELFLENGIIIAVGCYIVVAILRRLKVLDNKWMPLIAGGLGLALGIAFGATSTSILPDTSILTCAIKGLALGWTPIGGGEAFRQLRERKSATATATVTKETATATAESSAETGPKG